MRWCYPRKGKGSEKYLAAAELVSRSLDGLIGVESVVKFHKSHWRRVRRYDLFHLWRLARYLRRCYSRERYEQELTEDLASGYINTAPAPWAANPRGMRTRQALDDQAERWAALRRGRARS